MKAKPFTITPFLFVFLSFFSFGFRAQAQTGRVKGSVRSEKETALYAASVALFDAENKLIKAVLTDTEGAFTISRLRS
jgi:hypothetical protein